MRKANAMAAADRLRLMTKAQAEASVAGGATPKGRAIGGGALAKMNSFSEIDSMPTPEECYCDPHLLITEDFIVEETSSEKAKDAILDLENVEHVMDFVQVLYFFRISSHPLPSNILCAYWSIMILITI